MSSNKVRILYLEADNADAESVGALVGIVREVQGGRVTTRIDKVEATIELPEPAAAVELPAPRQPRQPRAAAPGGSLPRGRASDVGGKAIAYLRKSPRVDYPKLALALYGSSDPQNVKRSRNVLNRLVHTGKAKSDGAGTYTVVG